MTKPHNYLIALFLISSLLQTSTSKVSPDMVVVITRHGAREGLTDNWGSNWKNPTYIMDSGIEEHYTVGGVIAREYSELLEGIEPKEIYLQSSARPRAQMSVAAELLGLFQHRTHKHDATNRKDFEIPYENQELVNEVIDSFLKTPDALPNRLQLMSQVVKPLIEEDLVAMGPWNCKAIADGQKRRFAEKVNQDVFLTMSGTVAELRKLGYNIEDRNDFKEFGDDLQSRYYDNKPALEGIPYFGKIYNDAVNYFIWWSMYNLVGDDVEVSVRTYALYSRLIEWFTDKASGKSNLKLALLGGHETSLFPLLKMHQISNHSCFQSNFEAEAQGLPLPFPDCKNPPFGSQFMYEFYKNDGKPYIRMLHNGKPYKICPGSKGIECPLEDFIKEVPALTHHMTDAKVQDVCAFRSGLTEMLVSVGGQMGVYLFPLLTCLLGFLLGLSPYASKLKNRMSARKYAKGIKHVPLETSDGTHAKKNQGNNDQSDIIQDIEQIEGNKKFINNA